MENYEIIRTLAEKDNRITYLVKERESTSDNLFVIKKVECIDEYAANKTFRELITVNEVDHPNICKLKEFFVTMEKTNSSVHVCIVREYFPETLLSIIRHHAEKHLNPFDELIIKKWIGSIFDALNCLHDHAIFFRYLSPSNIVENQDKSIQLVDVGLRSNILDKKTNSHSDFVAESLIWLAPEAMTQTCGKKSDLWSLGSILLMAITVTFLDQKQFESTLVNIKRNPQKLDEILKQLNNIYSEDLILLIKTMMADNPDQRPSIEYLHDLPFVKCCLTLSNLRLLKKLKRQSMVTEPPQPLIKEKCLESIIQYITDFIDFGDCVKEALDYMEVLCTDEIISINSSTKQLILQALINNFNEQAVLCSGISLLNSLIHQTNESDYLFSKGAILKIMEIIKLAADFDSIQQLFCMYMSSLSTSANASELIGKVGGVHYIIKLLETHKSNENVYQAALSTLWNLSVNEKNAKLVTELNAVHIVCEGLKKYIAWPDIVEKGVAALFTFSLVDGMLTQFSENDVTRLLVHILDAFMRNAKIVKNCCMTLASIAEQDEESAYMFLDSENLKGEIIYGLVLLKTIHVVYKDNAEVVESLCCLILELLEYELILDEMKDLNFEEMLNELFKYYKENKVIGEPCTVSISKLEQLKKIQPKREPSKEDQKEKSDSEVEDGADSIKQEDDKKSESDTKANLVDDHKPKSETEMDDMKATEKEDDQKPESETEMDSIKAAEKDDQKPESETEMDSIKAAEKDDQKPESETEMDSIKAVEKDDQKPESETEMDSIKAAEKDDQKPESETEMDSIKAAEKDDQKPESETEMDSIKAAEKDDQKPESETEMDSIKAAEKDDQKPESETEMDMKAAENDDQKPESETEMDMKAAEKDDQKPESETEMDMKAAENDDQKPESETEMDMKAAEKDDQKPKHETEFHDKDDETNC